MLTTSGQMEGTPERDTDSNKNKTALLMEVAGSRYNFQEN